MPKYLLKASYTPEGIRGVLKGGGTARRAAVEQTVASLGGRVEAFYFAFGERDAYTVVDVPGNAEMAAMALSIGATGAVDVETVVLLTPEEIDQATHASVTYSPPGA
jgi:uncharacterized protein with GYD domain